MALGGKTLTVYLAADLKKFNGGLKDAEGGLKGFGQTLSRNTGPALLAAGAAAGAFAAKLAGQAIGAASDLAETQNKVGVIFGNSSKQMLAFADNAVTSLGQTREQALEGAATFAQFGKSAGLANEDLVNFSSELVTLSADLASFNNSSPEEAIQAIGAALRGEAEPMRRFGVLLDDATLKSKALEMGIYSGSGALTQQQKVLSAHQVIMSQTTDAQGDFARTSDGLANTQRILSAAVEDAKATIGEGLINALESASDAMGGPAGMAEAIESGARVTGDLTRGIGLLIGELADLKTATEDNTEQTDRYVEGTFGMRDTNNDFIRGLLQLIPIVGAYAGSLVSAGENARFYEERVDSAYDSTIALARAQRDARVQAEIDNRRLADSAYDSGIAAAVQADRIERLTKILGHVPGVIQETTDKNDRLTGSRNKGTQAADNQREAESKLTKAFNEQMGVIRGVSSELQQATRDLETARKSAEDYAAGIAAQITSGINLGTAFEGQFDEAGQRTGASLLDGFNKQIEQAQYFGNVLSAIKAQGADQSLIEQIASLGPVTGAALGQQMLDEGLVKTLSDKWVEVQDQTKTLAMGLVPEFMTAGIASGEAMVTSLAEQVKNETKILTRLGRQIAKPVGAGFKAQFLKDIADAVAEVEAIQTAARAEKVAAATARGQILTEQAVAQALGQIINRSDARLGVTNQPVLA